MEIKRDSCLDSDPVHCFPSQQSQTLQFDIRDAGKLDFPSLSQPTTLSQTGDKSTFSGRFYQKCALAVPPAGPLTKIKPIAGAVFFLKSLCPCPLASMRFFQECWETPVVAIEQTPLPGPKNGRALFVYCLQDAALFPDAGRRHAYWQTKDVYYFKSTIYVVQSPRHESNHHPEESPVFLGYDIRVPSGVHD